MTKGNTARNAAPAPRKAEPLTTVNTNTTEDSKSDDDKGTEGQTSTETTADNAAEPAKVRKGPIPDSGLAKLTTADLGQAKEIGGFKVFKDVEAISTPARQSSAMPIEALGIGEAFYVPYATDYKALSTRITATNKKYREKPLDQRKQFIGRSSFVDGVKVYWCKRIEPVELESDDDHDETTDNGTESAELNNEQQPDTATAA